MKRFISMFVLAATTALVGCGAGVQITTPDGFAKLEDQEKYDYRATSPEGVVIGVRREDNAPFGDLTFWSGALDAHMRRGGYKAVDAKPVKAPGGLEGMQLRYTVRRNGREHAFWLTVFVTEQEVITIEAGGDIAFFGGVEKSVSQAIASLRVT